LAAFIASADGCDGVVVSSMAYLASDRKNAVQLYKHGLSYKAIAQQLGFPNVKAASRVVNRFRNRKTFNDATRRKGRSKLNSNQRNRLKRVILRNPQASLREKRDMFNARPRNIEEGITVSTSTVSRFTQQHFDITAPPTAEQQQSRGFRDARIAFCKTRLRTTRIISLDGCEIDTRDLVNDINAKRVAVPRGTVPQPLPMPPHNAAPAVHLYASAANGKVPLSSSIFVPFKRKQQFVSAGQCSPSDREQQEAFASRHLAPVLKEVCRHAEVNGMKPGTWQLLLDGASQHTSWQAMQMLESAGISTVEDFPAHSPDLNPIERVWHLLREQLRKLMPKRGVPRSSEELEQLVLDAWSRVSRATVKKLMQALPGRMTWVASHDGQFPAK